MSMNEFDKAGHPVERARKENVDLLEIINTLWRGRLSLIVGFLLIACVAVIFSLRMPNIYRSEALLAPAPENQDAMSSIASKYGGLASIAGLNLGGLGKSTVDRATITLEMLKSRAFVVNFVREHELVVPLMAAEGWDIETRQWIIDNELYDQNRKVWIRPVSPPYEAEPSDLEIYDKFVDILTVTQDSSTSLVALAIESMSPIASRDWADWLIKDVNAVMRERDISQASKSIDYLERQLEETVVTEMRQIFYQLIEQETQKKMLAKVRQEYALEMIDPPVIPDEKISPKRGIIVIVSCFLGVLLIVAFLLLKESLFPYKERSAR